MRLRTHTLLPITVTIALVIFMNSKKHLVCLLVKYTFCSLFTAAVQEFDKLFTLSLSKSNSEFAFPPQ